jgi:putative DNA primase/helicase
MMSAQPTAANVVSLGKQATPPRSGRFKIKSREEILADDEPEWLIEGLYPQDALAQVFGEPDAYKTFAAISAACSVATGRPFLGVYEVKQSKAKQSKAKQSKAKQSKAKQSKAKQSKAKQSKAKQSGDVVYVYGEGGRGIGKRLRAWEESNQCEAERFYRIAEPVNMLSNEPAQVIADIRKATLSPVLIVLDTLARCFGDGDENSTKDMNAFVAGCDQLRHAFPGCTVLVVHHCGWVGTRPRGARAWEGALDTATKMERSADNLAALSVTKQKDFEKPEKAIALELVNVVGTGSAVVRLADAAKLKAAQDSTDKRVGAPHCRPSTLSGKHGQVCAVRRRS